MSTPAQTTAIEQVERVRNRLSSFLVGSFVAIIPLLFFATIADENKEILVYMIGQLSGMATLALGFYFVNKVGQDATDARRADTTGKLAAAMKALAENNGGATDPNAIRAGETVEINKPTEEPQT